MLPDAAINSVLVPNGTFSVGGFEARFTVALRDIIRAFCVTFDSFHLPVELGGFWTQSAGVDPGDKGNGRRCWSLHVQPNCARQAASGIVYTYLARRGWGCVAISGWT